MRSYLIAAFILLTSSLHLSAQTEKYLKNEARLIVDNDAFTLNFYKDQYYSSGIYPSFRYVRDTSSQRKIIHGFQLNHRIFTPKDILWRFEPLFDRPYAGQFSASFIADYYFRKGNYLGLEFELGWMGPSSKIGEMHTYYHQLFNLGEPRGWKYQINDTPLATIYINYAQTFLNYQSLELISESNIAVGTTNNWIRQELVIRFGNFMTIDQSSFYSGQLGKIKKKSPVTKMSEMYVFYAPGYEFVFYNATIEGNLIGKTSAFTKIAKRNIFQHRFGAVMSWPSFDFGILGYVRSPETTEATAHYYVGIRMNQRF